MYEFRKIPSENSKTEFQHPLFRRGEKELLKSIKRKKRDEEHKEIAENQKKIKVFNKNFNEVILLSTINIISYNRLLISNKILKN